MTVAVITGASRGLGLAVAQELDRRGWSLVLDARNVEVTFDVRSGLFGRNSYVLRAVDGGTARFDLLLSMEGRDTDVRSDPGRPAKHAAGELDQGDGHRDRG